MEKNTHRGKHRIDVENAIIRRREKQFNYDTLWNNTKQYFQHWEKNNSKYEQWTSPRYYEDNNKLMQEINAQKSKEENLKNRREKLRKLLEDEHKSYQIELMIQKNKILTEKQIKNRSDEIPTDLLKDVNIGLKLHEDQKRRHEAEMKLYHQWRINNPIVKQFESKFRNKDLKFSWLDQQIEKRMQQEKEEEDNRRILKERDELLKKNEEKERAIKIYLEEKRQQLKRQLDEQMEVLKQRRLLNEELKKQEKEEMDKQNAIENLEKIKAMEERRRLDRECALFNIQQHKMKLKQKLLDVQTNLEQDELLLSRIKEMELENSLSEETKKNEIKQGLKEFLSLVREQKELEKQRQRHMEFLFDSEARTLFERQCEIWKQEESARKELFCHVLETIKKQIAYNIHINNEKQKEILLEQECVANKIEEYSKEMKKLQDEEEIRKRENKKKLDDDLKVKNAKKKLEENFKLKEINKELDRIRKEEERLKQEIVNIQQKHLSRRYSRTSRL